MTRIETANIIAKPTIIPVIMGHPPAAAGEFSGLDAGVDCGAAVSIGGAVGAAGVVGVKVTAVEDAG